MKILVVDKKKFLKTDIDYLSLLEENNLFERTIKGIRKKFNYPEEGFTVELTSKNKIKITNFTKETNKKIAQVNQWIDKPVTDIIHAFNLPLCWWNTLYSIILLNIAVPPMRDKKWYKSIEVRYIGGLDVAVTRLQGKVEHPNELEQHIEIDIREGMTFAKLIHGLKKEKATIDRYLSFLDSTPDTKHLKDIDIKKEILHLEKMGKSDLEIADELESKYENKLPFAPDHNTVNHYKRRFKEMIQKEPSNKYHLYYLDKYLA